MSQTATAAGVSPITWFLIPTADFDRAHRFYETILEKPLSVMPFGGRRIAMFPHEEPAVTGCLDEGAGTRPADGGTVVYLKVADGTLDRTLARVTDAGGAVAEGKTELPGIGWVAQVIDSEGNRVGLHAIS